VTRYFPSYGVREASSRATPQALAPREIKQQVSWSHREYLRAATGAVLACGPGVFTPLLRALSVPRARKAVVVTFGGGARDQEMFVPEGQENIPNLLKELIPQATFFTQVSNRGILGHYVATATPATAP
jgi:hypothetical protein